MSYRPNASDGPLDLVFLLFQLRVDAVVVILTDRSHLASENEGSEFVF